ncbi:hypothetical protein KOI40_14760 [Aestuariicella sp. G3-2]|uniref:hypothetical protein n=1 Tax=Pseudomaricurvus albidus TaxID=2842452 RepID=UPI001C0D6C4E|nr:hypothetical protein [Aestuariicella albida]MBU3071083.1 hypothetical protein [Aestuariicella albida]
MNEIQRQQYLDALGIDSYMPRWILPVAPAPVSCEPVLPVNDAPSLEATPVSVPSVDEHTGSPAVTASNTREATATGETAAPATAGTVVSSLAEIVDKVKAPASPASPVTDSSGSLGSAGKATPEQQTTAVEVDPHFSLSLWRVSEDLVIVDSRHAELALPTEPLLANILFALGLPRQPLARAEVLRWPMYDHRLAPKGEAAARETVLAMLEGKLEAQPARYLLLMGAEACHFVLPADLLPENGDAEVSYKAMQGRALTIEALQATAIVVPSLCDMLQQPELKAVTWRSIQPLRQS